MIQNYLQLLILKDKLIFIFGFSFFSNGAHGVVRKGTSLQVIVGLDVPQVREEFEKLLEIKPE